MSKTVIDYTIWEATQGQVYKQALFSGNKRRNNTYSYKVDMEEHEANLHSS